MNQETAVAMAATLYEARRASRFMLGDARWREHMQFIGEAIKLCQKRTGLDTIQAAMKMCEYGHKNGGPASDSVHILSAAVELVEPSEPPNFVFGRQLCAITWRAVSLTWDARPGYRALEHWSCKAYTGIAYSTNDPTKAAPHI